MKDTTSTTVQFVLRSGSGRLITVYEDLERAKSEQARMAQREVNLRLYKETVISSREEII